MSTLGDQLLAIHEGLSAASIPHAFGGAIALAYCTFEPRGTRDLDVNVFLPAGQADQALAVLLAGVVVTTGNRQQIADHGQTRLWWETTPVDMFFNNVRFHAIAAARVRQVDFVGNPIPVLDCTSLAVFKAFFNRTRDWADLDAMNDADQLDVVAVRAFLSELLREDDPRLDRLDALSR